VISEYCLWPILQNDLEPLAKWAHFRVGQLSTTDVCGK